VTKQSPESQGMFNGFYKGKRVLVTGHTGFKGSWLALWLHDLGARVTGLALPPNTAPSHFELIRLQELITHIEGDIRNEEIVRSAFEKAKPEIVFHLAAQPLVRDSYDDPKTTFDTNIGGTVNILEAIRHCPSVKAAVIVTSDKCYENREWVWGYRENDPMGGHDPYSASKGAAEIVCAAYRHSFFDKTAAARISALPPPGQATSSEAATGPRTGSSQTASALCPRVSRSSSVIPMPPGPGSMSLILSPAISFWHNGFSKRQSVFQGHGTSGRSKTDISK